MLTSRLAAVKQNFHVDPQAAKSKASKNKKLAHKAEKKLDLARVALEDMSETYQDCLLDR